MSRSIHLFSKAIFHGGGTPDGICLPCSGVSGRALCISHNSSRGNCKLISDVKFLSLRCTSRYTSSVCNASSNSYRRNPDFPRQNKQPFSRHRNRHNSEERDGYEELEETETFSSRNGPFLSVSANQKFQATSTPGPREKEIVELFRKVQAQLRERASIKEGRKVEDSQGKSKESETVDSLLKLLRKHSVQQGKKSNTTNTNNRDFILDQHDQVSPSATEKRSISDSTNGVKHEVVQESPSPSLSRPKSSFHKRSPVPEIKFQPIYLEGSTSSISEDNLDGVRKLTADIREEVESDSESDEGPMFSERNVFDDVSEDEIEEVDEREHDVDTEEEQKLVEAIDLSGMKMTELRALAKSRGMKGFSKLKKHEIIGLLSE